MILDNKWGAGIPVAFASGRSRGGPGGAQVLVEKVSHPFLHLRAKAVPVAAPFDKVKAGLDAGLLGALGDELAD